jgi:cysteine desulfurase
MVGQGAEAERIQIARLRDMLIDGITALRPNFRLNGPTGNLRHPGNANILVDTYNAHDLLATLQPKLAAATGSACTSGMSEPSHVLRAIGLTSEQAEASIRLGVGRFSTCEEVEAAVELIGTALIDSSLDDRLAMPVRRGTHA